MQAPKYLSKCTFRLSREWSVPGGSIADADLPAHTHDHSINASTDLLTFARSLRQPYRRDAVDSGTPRCGRLASIFPPTASRHPRLAELISNHQAA
jgi:hypothetical protein